MKLPGRKVVFLTIVVLALLASAGFVLLKNFRRPKAEPVLGVQPFWAGQTVNQGLPADEANYQKALKGIIADLMARLDNSDAVKDSQVKILTLAAPAQYRQLHLSLVVALEHLAQTGQSAEGKKELAAILAKEEWLLMK